MGYSCNAVADFALDSMINQFQERCESDDGTSNGWKYNGANYFYERGREQSDGSITGTVMKFTDDTHCKRCGTIKIDSDGNVVRFPTSTKGMRQKAKQYADEELTRRDSRLICIRKRGYQSGGYRWA